MSAPWLDAWRRERGAGTPLVALATPDVFAGATAIASYCGEQVPCVIWSCSSGLTANAKAGQAAVSLMCESLGGLDPSAVSTMADALVAGRGLPDRGVLVVLWPHLHWDQPMVRDAAALLRDAYKADGRTLVLVAQDLSTLPLEIGPDVRVLRESMPDRAARRQLVAATYADARAANPELPELAAEDLDEAVDATAGLTAFMCEQATCVALSLQGLDAAQLALTAREAVNARKGLRVSDERLSYADVGGQEALASYVRALFRGPDRPAAVVLLDEIEKMLAGSAGGDLSGVSQDLLGALLTWIEQRRVHGILLMGPPGSGKSLSAQAAAGEHEVPLVWMDVGSMKGSLVGESGANLRAALDTIDAVSDGRALLVATCNGVAELKPELLRRFKPRFVVDLPGPRELERIWQIQLAAHELPADSPRPDSAGWTGAEVRDACRIARATACTPAEAARYVVPISKSSAEAIARTRREATGRFICASAGGPYAGPPAEDLAGSARPGPGRRLQLDGGR